MVARVVRDDEVAGSNPVSPTHSEAKKPREIEHRPGYCRLCSMRFRWGKHGFVGSSLLGLYSVPDLI